MDPFWTNSQHFISLLDPIVSDDFWSNPERIIALLGSIVSIVSILVNIFQWMKNSSTKRTAKTIVSIALGGFNSILTLAIDLESKHPEDYDRLISGIRTSAEREKEQLEKTSDLFD